MAKKANYGNKKTTKKLTQTVAAIESALPKLKAAIDGGYLRHSELKVIGGLSAKLHAAFVFLTHEVSEQDKE